MNDKRQAAKIQDSQCFLELVQESSLRVLNQLKNKPASQSKQSCSAKAGRKGSPLLWLLAFVGLTLCLVLAVPKSWLDAADGVNGSYRRLVSKLSAYVSSEEEPDLIFLGSSLVLIPAAHCDNYLHAKAAGPDFYDSFIPEYTKAEYLENLLAKENGSRLQIKNLGVASSIASDQLAIYKLLKSEKKLPRMLILGLAPRDFLDNTQQAYKQTPTAQFVQEHEDRSILPAALSLEECCGAFERFCHRGQKVLSRLKFICTNLAKDLRGESAAAPVQACVPGPVWDREARLKKDLDTYRKLYNPANFEMLKTQSGFLDELLRSAKENHVEVLVINMPLRKMNTDLLDKKAYKAYLEQLSALSKTRACEFLDLGSNTGKFVDSDFEDSCHLNLEGAKKFYACLPERIKLEGAAPGN